MGPGPGVPAGEPMGHPVHVGVSVTPPCARQAHGESPRGGPPGQAGLRLWDPRASPQSRDSECPVRSLQRRPGHLPPALVTQRSFRQPGQVFTRQTPSSSASDTSFRSKTHSSPVSAKSFSVWSQGNGGNNALKLDKRRGPDACPGPAGLGYQSEAILLGRSEKQWLEITNGKETLDASDNLGHFTFSAFCMLDPDGHLGGEQAVLCGHSCVFLQLRRTGSDCGGSQGPASRSRGRTEDGRGTFRRSPRLSQGPLPRAERGLSCPPTSRRPRASDPAAWLCPLPPFPPGEAGPPTTSPARRGQTAGSVDGLPAPTPRPAGRGCRGTTPLRRRPGRVPALRPGDTHAHAPPLNTTTEVRFPTTNFRVPCPAHVRACCREAQALGCSTWCV